jgi:hypothetical protein
MTQKTLGMNTEQRISGSDRRTFGRSFANRRRLPDHAEQIFATAEEIAERVG